MTMMMSSPESDVLTDYSQLHVAIAAGKKRRQIDDKDITRTRHSLRTALRNSNISYFTSLHTKVLNPAQASLLFLQFTFISYR